MHEHAGNQGRLGSPPVTADVVLIDGRFRVAVALKSLWHIHAASVVLVHDWTSRAAEYGRILKYYDIVGSVDTLIILSRKRVDQVDWKSAQEDLAKYLNEPARR